ncbi:hypothetical protein HUU53_00925 [Candidatus Micrarchaeota archaeon]|nr:hypothetical protein [Candidatus Micrarchaeota archaeon]
MEFKILFESKTGNLVLESDEAKGLERKDLFQNSVLVARIFDTIGSVEKPFYLAKPVKENLNGFLSDYKNKKGGLK